MPDKAARTKWPDIDINIDVNIGVNIDVNIDANIDVNIDVNIWPLCPGRFVWHLDTERLKVTTTSPIRLQT